MSAKKNNLENAKKKNDKETPEVSVFVAPRNGKAGREVVARWGKKEFIDILDPFKATSRDRFVKRVADKFGIEGGAIQDDLADRLVSSAKEADVVAERLAREAAEAATSGNQDLSAKALTQTPKDIIAAAEAYLENPDLMGELAEDLAKLGIAGETQLATTLYLIGTSRMLDTPLGGTVKSSSASGKSFVSENVTALMPPEQTILATNITPNALYYKPTGSLRYKLVVVGERTHASAGDQAEAANATLALREMLSRGRLDKYVPMRAEDGSIQTQRITQQGPISYIDTTTQQEIFEEDSTRMLSLTTDESSEQTQAVMKIQAKQAAGFAELTDEQERIRQKHQTAQRLLAPMKVRVPYALHLVLPSTKLVARRAFPQLLGCIRVVALLRQRHKTVQEGGHINAAPKDYEIAYTLMRPILQRTFAALGERAKTLLAAILENALVSQSFTRNECVQWAGVGLTEVRNRLALLVEAGLVEQLAGGKGVSYKYRVINTKAEHPAIEGLITPGELETLLKKSKAAKKTKATGSPAEKVSIGSKPKKK